MGFTFFVAVVVWFCKYDTVHSVGNCVGFIKGAEDIGASLVKWVGLLKVGVGVDVFYDKGLLFLDGVVVDSWIGFCG